MDVLVKAMAQDEPVLVVALIDTKTVEKARVLHDTFPTATAALGRTMSAALLLTALLKEGQKVIVQVVGDGPLQGVVAEADSQCRTRCYIKQPHVHLGLKDGKLDVGRAVGKGFFNVIKDLGLRDYYQGSVPLQTGEIATDLAFYLSNSEQIPAAVSLGVYVETDNSAQASGGFMIHSLPGAGDEIIDYLEARLKNVRQVSAMIREGLGPQQIIDEALGLPFKILEEKEVTYYCHCTRGRVLDTIASIGKQDIEDLIARGETVQVQCEFCRAEYQISHAELEALVTGRGNGTENP